MQCSAPELELADEAATLALGEALAKGLAAALGPDDGCVIFLEGDLGAGKTTLTRGVLRGLGFAGKVRSPTYTLVEPYAISKLELHHFDFYRFNHPDEFLEAGLDEYFRRPGICLVEWPDKAGAHLPPPDLRIRLRIAGAGRGASLDAVSARGRQWLSACPPPIGAAS